VKAVTIRKIKRNELNELIALYTHLHKNDSPLPSPGKLKKIWNEILKDPYLHYFVIKRDSKLVSSCALSIIPNITCGARPYGLIEHVVTHTNYRRKGFGKAVLKYALNFAWRKNCYKVMLLSGVYRNEAHKLYETVGFNKKDKVGYVVWHK
jgi:GNAT superfamily N-acetyltransferase